MNKTNDSKLLQNGASDYPLPSPNDHQVGESGGEGGICKNTWGGPSQEGGQDHQGKEVPDQGGDGESANQGSEEENKNVSPLAYFCQGEEECQIKSNASYSTIYFGPNKQGQCLVDSGNLVASAMSGNFARQMGIPIQSYQGNQCPAALAPDGRTMEVIGQTGPLTFTFKGAPNTTFESNMVVIEGLSHQVNLGKAWLTEHRALHDHAREMIKLKRPKQHGWTTVQLRGPQDDDQEEDRTRYVYGQMRTRIPARSARYIPVTIPSMTTDQDVVIIPVEGSRCPALIAKSLSTVKDKRCMAAVFNPLDKAVFVEKWCKLAEAEDLVPDSVLGHMSEATSEETSAGDMKQRREWVNKEFRLGDSDVLHNDPKAVRDVENLLVEYWDVLSKSKTDYGCTDMIELEIDLTPGAKPYRGRCLPTNPKEEEDLWETLQEWNRQGVTEPANSPWGAPLIPVRKKDGRLRWCVDFRRLNEVTVKDSYPLPLITTNLHKLGSSSIFSTIDGTGAYHNVPIAERDRPLTAFISPFGQFQFKRMPFGLCNAPQAYSRLVEMVLAGIDPRYVLAYIDDIIVHTKTVREHMEILRQVLEAHRKGGLKVAPAKSFLFRSKVDYLGHQVSQNGIEMLSNYVTLLLDWPKPTTPKELATFLGKSGYYRQFIPNYGKVVACLEQEKKKTSLTWTPQMDRAFEQVKEAFRTKPILAFPDYQGVQEGRPFIFDSDWCQEGMAQAISQQQPGPDGVRERVIAHGGRKCTVAERNYSSNKGETCSFTDGLQRFEHILRYAPFRARVDNRCLSYIRNLKKPTGIWCRWLELIESFQFKIEHRAGKKHANVDALSRAPHLPPPTEEMERRSAAYLCALTETQLDEVERLNRDTLMEMEELVEEIGKLPLSNQQIRQAQRDDPDVRTVFNLVGEGVKPTKDERRRQSWEIQQMLQDFETLHIHQGLLYKRQLENEPRLGEQGRLVLPKQLRLTAFHWVHANKESGHLGMSKTQGRMRMRFYFPGLYHYVERQILGCHKCLQKKGLKPRADLMPRNNQKGYPGARWSLDLVGPLTETDKGNVYILTAEDVFTRYPVAVPIPDKTAETVAKAFEQAVMADHGSFSQLLTDNAQELTGHIIQDVAKILGISKVETVPYNPNSSKVERFHRTLGDMLRSVVDDTQKDWDDCLPACLLAYRTSVHATTRLTPFFLMHGREAMLPIDLIFPRPPQEYKVATVYGQEMAERLDKAFAYVRDQQEKVIKRQVSMATEQFKEKPLTEGELVWYYSPQQQVGKSRKLRRGWRGPFKVVQVISEVTYIIQPTGSWTDKRPKFPVVIHRLQRYFPDTATPSEETQATEAELIKELVDVVDENLEATDAVSGDEEAKKVSVEIPRDDEVDDIVDWVTRRNKEGGGRAGWMENFDKDLTEYFGLEQGIDDEIMKETMNETSTVGKQMEGFARELKDGVHREERDEATSRRGSQSEKVQVRRAKSSQQESTSGRELARQRDQQTKNTAKEQVSGQGSVNKRALELDDEERDQADRGSKEQVTDSRRRSARIQKGGADVPFWITPRTTYETQSTRQASSSGRAGLPAVPAYMAAGAQAAAVAPVERAKRAREEESNTDDQHIKQVKVTTGTINAMTEAFGHLHVRNLKVKVEAVPTMTNQQVDEDEAREREDNPVNLERMRHQREEIRHERRQSNHIPNHVFREPPYHTIRLKDGAKMPVQEYSRAVGYDCFAFKEVRIPRGETAAVPLGFQMSPASGQFARLAETSSWPFQKPGLLLRSGVLDPDYRGQVAALFTYMGEEEFGYVEKGERCAQLIFSCFRCAPWHSAVSFDRGDRGGSAGFIRHLVPGPDGGIPVNAKRGRGDGGRDAAQQDESQWRSGQGQEPATASVATSTEEADQMDSGIGRSQNTEDRSPDYGPPNTPSNDTNNSMA